MIDKPRQTAVLDSKRFAGALHGLILGDIIGSYHEFSAPAARSCPDMSMLTQRSNVFGIRFGYTDDTILALAAMDAFVHDQGEFCETTQITEALKYLLHSSPWSPTGQCFDIGLSTRRSLLEGEWHGKRDSAASGNGVLMRLLPYTWHAASQLTPKQETHDTSAPDATTAFYKAVAGLTHGSRETVETACTMGDLLSNLLSGMSWQQARTQHNASYSVLTEMDARRSCSGFCEDSLILAIHLMDRDLPWQDAINEILSVGGDTDTNAAIFGQFYGALHPDDMLKQYNACRSDIHRADKIDRLVQDFLNVHPIS